MEEGRGFLEAGGGEAMGVTRYRVVSLWPGAPLALMGSRRGCWNSFFSFSFTLQLLSTTPSCSARVLVCAHDMSDQHPSTPHTRAGTPSVTSPASVPSAPFLVIPRLLTLPHTELHSGPAFIWPPSCFPLYLFWALCSRLIQLLPFITCSPPGFSWYQAVWHTVAVNAYCGVRKEKREGLNWF